MNLHLILISILEGITEFLPVSSTAHIIILSKLFNIDTTTEYIKFFLLFIQFGALIAGVSLFSKRIISDKKILSNILISFIPTAVIGFVLYKVFKKLLEGNMLLMAIMLALGGIIFIILEKRNSSKANQGKDINDINYKEAFIIGLSQSLAIIPGVSRSGSTIIAGLLLNIKKSAIIEYTFLLAIPTITAAVLYDFYKSFAFIASMDSYAIFIYGFIIAFISAYLILIIVKKYLNKISLTAFGWYRILLAVIIISLFPN